jgi:ADP-heptose:LPS heptosyltransferase
MESPIRKVLIYRLGSLGDAVVALPSLHLIARSFPAAERVLLTNFPVHAKAPAAAAVLGDSGLIHGTMRYTVGTRQVGELLGLAREIRRFRPDLLVYLMPLRPWKNVRRDRIFFRVAGVRRIVGLPDEAERVHRFDETTGLYESEAVRLAKTIAVLGESHPEDLANWDLHLNAQERAAAERALAPLQGRPLLVCAPGCKMQANDWEQERWRALLGRLYRRYPSYGLVMAGAKQDAAVCEYAAQDWASAKLNLAGRLNPRESAGVFSQAEVFLGPDSGPKHLAASMGTACVCAFGARNLPGVWFPPGTRNQILFHRPECSGCGLETCILEEKRCIRSVTVEEMEQAVGRVLDSANRR